MLVLEGDVKCRDKLESYGYFKRYLESRGREMQRQTGIKFSFYKPSSKPIMRSSSAASSTARLRQSSSTASSTARSRQSSWNIFKQALWHPGKKY